MRSVPDTFQAPYPAFQAHPGEERPEFVAGLIGIQARRGADPSELVDKVAQLLCDGGPGGPDHTERSDFAEDGGIETVMLLPYWKTREDQAAWLERADWKALLETPLKGDLGLFAECFQAPTRQLDGNYSLSEINYGIGRHSEIKPEQFHAYMGSMRDRVPGFLSGESDGELGRLARLEDPAESLGRVVTVSDLPANLCYIRSGFAWKGASAEEQQAFMDEMYPVYREGSEYLVENPLESNCISMRMTDTQGVGFESGLQSSSISWFLTLQDLERWVRSHPRHLAIMRTIMGYMKRFDFKPQLNLGHEVVVVPEGDVTAVYNNCTQSTGFLPYFASQELG